VLLAVVLAVCTPLFSVLVGVPAAGEIDAEALAAEGGRTLALLFLVGLAEAAVMTYLILRARQTGWALVATVFVAFFGLNTLINQLESLVYLGLPPDTVTRLIGAGALVAAVFAVAAVALLGKWQARLVAAPRLPGLRRSAWGWVWRLAAVAGIYVALYFCFGYFVAWARPEVRAFYGGAEAASLVAQVAAVWDSTPWMFAFQAFRGLLWAVLALPVIGVHPGGRWEVCLATAMLFSVWSLQLLLPNPYMPEAVARIHLMELAGSNLVFGALTGAILARSGPRLQPLAVPSRGFPW